MPIAPPNAAPQAPAQAPAQPQPSFRERKAAQLSGERDVAAEAPPVERADPTLEERTLHQDTESTEDLTQDSPQGQADDEYEEDDDGQLSEDPDGTLDASSEDDTEGSHDWEKRYSDLRSEYDRVTGSREEMTSEHAEAMGETLRLRFDLEDRMQEAVGRAEYMANVMNGNANQYRNINWSQVPAEQLPQVQAAAQQALAQEQQATAAWNQVKEQSDEAMSVVKQREAAIAKTRLKRSIGLNNEVYGQLREYATSRGMDLRQFNEITNPVIIEDMHHAMTMRAAGNTVQTSNKRKAKVPRGRGAKQSPRDARGKFAKSEVAPNQRGSFADKHKHRLAMERQGR